MTGDRQGAVSCGQKELHQCLDNSVTVVTGIPDTNQTTKTVGGERDRFTIAINCHFTEVYNGIALAALVSKSGPINLYVVVLG